MVASSWGQGEKKKEERRRKTKGEKQKTAGLFSFGGSRGVSAQWVRAYLSSARTENQKPK